MPDNASQYSSNAFIDRFLNGMPRALADSFSAEQLQAVQRAFGMRYAQLHSIDLRRSIGLHGRKFYVVLLVGRERRTDAAPPRYRLPCGALAAAVSAALLLLL